MNPLFQVTHSFSLGSQTVPASYNFGVIFANANVRFSAHPARAAPLFPLGLSPRLR